MADRITKADLRAQRDGLATTLVDVQRELLAARAEIERLRQQLAHPPMQIMGMAAIEANCTD